MPPSGREKAPSTTLRDEGRGKRCRTVTTTSGKTISLQDVNRRNCYGESLLHQTVVKKDIQLLKDILKLRPDVNVTDNAGWTALHEAALLDQYEACLCLINAGACVNVAAANGVTPLHDAIISGNWRISALLKKHGAKPGCNASTRVGSGSQNVNIRRGTRATLSRCRRRTSQKLRCSPSMALQQIRPRQAGSGDSSGPIIYYKRQAVSVTSIHRKDCFGETLLHKAAKEGNAQTVRQFLKLGADVNMADNAGWTPLHEAAFYGHYHVTLELLKAGALVNAAACNGVTPLQDAIANGHQQIVDVLGKSKPQEGPERNRVSKKRVNVPADRHQQTPGLEMHDDIRDEGVNESNSNAQSEHEAVEDLTCPQPQTRISAPVNPQDRRTQLETNVQTSPHHPLLPQEARHPSNPIYGPKSQLSSTSSAKLSDGREEDSDSDQTVDYLSDHSDKSVDWALEDTQDFRCASSSRRACEEGTYMYTFPTERV